MTEKEIMKELDIIKDLIKSEKYTFENQYIKAIDEIIALYNKEKEKNKEYFKTLCNYEDTLGYYEDTLENLLDKYSELYNLSVADEHTIYLRELILDLEKLFKKILNCECKKEIKNKVINDFISKDKIKEKIEKLETECNNCNFAEEICNKLKEVNGCTNAKLIKILEELLQEGDK